MTLSELAVGSSAVVVSISPDAPQRRRLLDLGIVPGAVVLAERLSPLGDPTAYRVRGTLVALRRAQAGGVVVRPQDAPAAGCRDGSPGSP